jgi:hypothetical protein
MTHKTVSAILTIILLVITAAVILIAELVALNGYGEREGTFALGASLLCQGAGIVIAALVSSRLSGWLVTRFDWHKALSVIVAVIAGSLLGGGFGVISILFALAVAEGMR